MCNNVVKVCNKGPTIFFCPVNVTHVYKTITYNLEYMTSRVPFLYPDISYKLFIEIYGTFGTNYLGLVTENSSFIPSPM